ncbi:MAG: SLC13 family permease [Chloroflexota bacterium]|nr:SLC13 family permease [Chloroflexota bacterium]
MKLDRSSFNIGVKLALPITVFAIILLMPNPTSLSIEGQRALAVMALVVILWATEAISIAVTGLLGVVLLVLLGTTGTMSEAIHGFSHPVAYFLIGILTLGLAVHRSGLAERLSMILIRGSNSRPTLLYIQMLFSFALLTFALPSASTRGAILIHVYQKVLDSWGIDRIHPFNRAIMMALGTLNRLASTALLAGGITPVVTSALLGGEFSWTQWFLLMSVPFYLNLIIGGFFLYLIYRKGFQFKPPRLNADDFQLGKLKPIEIRSALIVSITALLWFTDFIHGMHPAIPALIALVIILLPRIGIMTWTEFERDLGWSNFFVIATSLSIANVLVTTGAAAWSSELIVGGVTELQDNPTMVLLIMSFGFAIVRFFMPNGAGYFALMIPIVMASGQMLGLNPLICGMAVVVVGDSVVYYAAGGTSAVFVFQNARISGPEIFKFAVIMTLVTICVLFAVAIPYWKLLGHILVS